MVLGEIHASLTSYRNPHIKAIVLLAFILNHYSHLLWNVSKPSTRFKNLFIERSFDDLTCDSTCCVHRELYNHSRNKGNGPWRSSPLTSCRNPSIKAILLLASILNHYSHCLWKVFKVMFIGWRRTPHDWVTRNLIEHLWLQSYTHTILSHIFLKSLSNENQEIESNIPGFYYWRKSYLYKLYTTSTSNHCSHNHYHQVFTKYKISNHYSQSL